MQHPIEQNDPKRFSSEKENQYFDRKSARKDANDISRHISAFANASGGKLVIGIEDDGEITGFRRRGAHDIEDFLQAPSRAATPSPPSGPRRSTSPTRAGRAIASSSSTSRPQQTGSSRESATARSSSGRRTRASDWTASRFAPSSTTRTRGASRTSWQTGPASTTSTAR